MTQATVIEGTTQHAREWSANEQTPDLMTAFTDAIEARRALTPEPIIADDHAIEATIQWSLGLRPDVGAEQLRREAW